MKKTFFANNNFFNKSENYTNRFMILIKDLKLSTVDYGQNLYS